MASSSVVQPSQYTPDEYERTSYHNGIGAKGHSPKLLYRSNCLMPPFPKPVGQSGQIPVKSLRGMFNTSLNGVWDTVSRQIVDIMNARSIDFTTINSVRFFTHSSEDDDKEGSLGPPVIWVGVRPGSTTSETAYAASQEILELLLKNGVEDVVIEWTEAVVRML
ncbi:hypothetical protein H0H93_016266 [Arthromyces matolae]|nr:hypothetical protein H0H93_016266 [Arthromyces matolae]